MLDIPYRHLVNTRPPEGKSTALSLKITVMFYEGDLQSGIAKAVQEGKSVLCFISGTIKECAACVIFADQTADDSDEATTWSQWLREGRVRSSYCGIQIVLN